MDDLTGKVIGRYRLVKLLGQGSVGSVYLGEKPLSDQKVAVKVLFPFSWIDIKSHLAEAVRISTLLDHSHILRLIEASYEEEIAYLVMSYAPFGSIRSRHPRGQPFPLPAVVSYAKQVAGAVQHAHDVGLMHGFIDPDQLLVEENTFVLLDFTDAFLKKALLAFDFIFMEKFFSARYVAPEQLHRKPQKASDQFTLGVIVYEWLAGVNPFPDFSGPNPESIPTQFRQYAIPSLRVPNPAVPEAVEQVVLKALSKYPDDRYESVAAFAAALEKASKDRP